MYSKCYYSISVRLTVILTVEKHTSEGHLSKETNIICISSKWPKNSMQFTLGMPFLGVLGKFYRNRKGLICIIYILIIILRGLKFMDGKHNEIQHNSFNLA